MVDFKIYDPNFRGCPEPGEEVSVSLKQINCGSCKGPSQLVISCLNVSDPGEGSGTAVVLFYPKKDCCNRSFTLTVEDKRHKKDEVTVQIPDRAPAVHVEPSSLKGLRPGDVATAIVSCEADPDGDTVELVKVAGPGEFLGLTGTGRLRGTWRWSVPREGLWSSHRAAAFEARSRCGSSSRASIVLTILTPPIASDTDVWVHQSGKGTAWAYVYDSDSPWVSVQVDPHPYPGISVAAEVQDDPLAPGMGGFMVTFGVSVESSVCDGNYSIPFTVIDPDGNESSATLVVHVRGNQSPQASPPYLYGEATVTLPSGASSAQSQW